MTIQSRLFIGNIPKQCTTDDITKLVNKICPVIEVYIPKSTITGIDRNFAIVITQSDEETTNKCIKALNSCYWKGNKIYLSYCKSQYYKTKLENEKLVSVTTINANEVDNAAQTIEPEDILPYIRIKHNNSVINAGIYPSDSVENDLNIVYSKKKVFQYDENDMIIDDIPNIDDYFINKDTKEPDKNKNKPKRQGFGNVVINSKVQDSTIDCCIENTPLDNQEIDSNEFPENPIDVQEFCKSYNNYSMSMERQRYLHLLNDMTNQQSSISNHNNNNSSNNSSNPLDVKTRSNPISSLIVKRFDPKKSDYQLSTKLSNETAKIEESKLVLPEAIIVNSHIDSVNNSKNTVVSTVKDTNEFADLNQLKDIFYKEGGVWWGDDGTLKEQVHKGDVVEDQLFLEAEKLGIDIRSNNTTSDMKFNFFDEIEEPVVVVSNLQTTTIENIQPITPAIHNSAIIHPIANSSLAHESQNKMKNKFNDDIELYHKIMSYDFIIKELKSFKRQLSEDDIKESWLNSKEKFRLIFKRLKKESNKKYNKSHQSN